MRLLRILFYSAIILGLSIYFYDSSDDSQHSEESHRYGAVHSYDNTPFQSLNISCNCKVELHQGEQWSVSFPEHNAPSLKGYVQGDTYYLRGGYSKRSQKDVAVHITTPDLRRLEMGGTSSLKGNGTFHAESMSIHMSGATETELAISTTQLHVYLAGATELELTGNANHASYSISGAGELEAFDLKTTETQIEISGAGDAEVYVSQSLDARVLGAGEVRYKGHPDHIKQHISGVGSIEAD